MIHRIIFRRAISFLLVSYRGAVPEFFTILPEFRTAQSHKSHILSYAPKGNTILHHLIAKRKDEEDAFKILTQLSLDPNPLQLQILLLS